MTVPCCCGEVKMPVGLDTLRLPDGSTHGRTTCDSLDSPRIHPNAPMTREQGDEVIALLVRMIDRLDTLIDLKRYS